MTVRQIVWKCGPVKLVKLLGSSRAAQRRWYDKGIPGRHWQAMVGHFDWLTYELLADATTIALKKYKRAA